MATKKKYVNNIDSGARHHYDVYQVVGDTAIHVAPFTQEMEAFVVAEALAAYDALNNDLDSGVTYIVRARPTVAHTIHKRTPRQAKRAAASLAIARENMRKLFDEPTVFVDPESAAVAPMAHEIAMEQAKPKRKILRKKKDKVA